MLIEFSVNNFLSFNEAVTLSMVAANPVKEHREDNVFLANRYHLLKSAVIYGANASGKSNLLKAMRFMKWFVLNSSKESQADEPINVTPFKLNPATKNKPSLFEIVFLNNGAKYRYGFQVDKNRITAEWLFRANKVKEFPLFLRQDDGIEVMRIFKEGKGLEIKTRDNALFLSVCAQFNGEISIQLMRWFRTNFNHISGITDREYAGFTVDMLMKNRYREKIVDFLKIADVGIDDVKIVKIKESSYFREFKKLFEKLTDEEQKKFLEKSPPEEPEISKKLESSELITKHTIYDSKKKAAGVEYFDFDKEESEGTKKYLRLAGPIIDTLLRGAILIVDELDARLHPSLTRAIVKLFNSKETNANNAQLIFATHDTNILSSEMFRRDQIWFTEKKNDQSTDLYSLVEFKLANGKVRNDASLEKNYLRGRYGAIPVLGNFKEVVRGA